MDNPSEINKVTTPFPRAGKGLGLGAWLLSLLSRLPFKVLYVISDIAYFFVYCLVGYRKNIVRKNLSASFPEKSERRARRNYGR